MISYPFNSTFHYPFTNPSKRLKCDVPLINVKVCHTNVTQVMNDWPHYSQMLWKFSMFFWLFQNLGISRMLNLNRNTLMVFLKHECTNPKGGPGIASVFTHYECVMYTTWCLFLYHNPIYCWALSIYNYFNLIQMPLFAS